MSSKSEYPIERVFGVGIRNSEVIPKIERVTFVKEIAINREAIKRPEEKYLILNHRVYPVERLDKEPTGEIYG